MLALVGLLDGTLRFGQLRRRVDGVSEKMLAQALHALERDGLVERSVQSAIPPHVEYCLTDLGHDAAERARDMLVWVEQHMSQIGSAQRDYDRAGGKHT